MLLEVADQELVEDVAHVHDAASRVQAARRQGALVELLSVSRSECVAIHNTLMGWLRSRSIAPSRAGSVDTRPNATGSPL